MKLWDPVSVWWNKQFPQAHIMLFNWKASYVILLILQSYATDKLVLILHVCDGIVWYIMTLGS